jgi:tripartite-type tricarboxylate transporter receptor subunit TctC
VAETLPGYEQSIWLGVMAQGATPLPIRERINAELNRILELPATRDAQARLGAQPMPMSIAEFDGFLRADITRQAEFIRLAKMTPA